MKVSTDDCWYWAGTVSPHGYGRLYLGGRLLMAHKVIYEALVGSIPEGLVIDHLCSNRICINPEHLEPVTQRENNLRSPISQASINSAKTHCVKGHEYTEANTIYRARVGWRSCRECANAWQRRKLKEKAELRKAGLV